MAHCPQRQHFAPVDVQRTVVTPLIRQAVANIPYAFFYLYPIPLEIKVDKKLRLVFKVRPLHWKLIPWFLCTLVITFSLGWGSCVYICLLTLFGFETKSYVEWSLFNTLMIVGLALAATAEIAGYLILFQNPRIPLAFGNLQELERRCTQCIRPQQFRVSDKGARVQKRDLLAHDIKDKDASRLPSSVSASHPHLHITGPRLPKNGDTIGALFNVMVFLVGVMPPFITVGGIAANLDPFYFIFEDILLPCPYYRSMELIVIVPIVRFFLGYICIIDFIRFGVIITILAVITVFTLVSITKKLKFVFYDQCLNFYVQLHLLLKPVISLINIMIGVAIFVGHFALVLILWFIFRCYELLPIVIYSATILLAAYITLLFALLLPAVANIRTQTSGLIKGKQNLHYCTNYKNARKYYYYSLWKSQQSVYFTCWDFFLLKKGVTMTFFRELVNNLVNAVILIDPKAI